MRHDHLRAESWADTVKQLALQTHALRDSNPRHSVLETDVLPTELRTHAIASKGKRRLAATVFASR